MNLLIRNISMHEKGRVRRTVTPTNVIDFYIDRINVTRISERALPINEAFYRKNWKRLLEAERLGLIEIVGDEELRKELLGAEIEDKEPEEVEEKEKEDAEPEEEAEKKETNANANANAEAEAEAEAEDDGVPQITPESLDAPEPEPEPEKGEDLPSADRGEPTIEVKVQPKKKTTRKSGGRKKKKGGK